MKTDAILVAKEKHGTRYFRARTDAQLYASALTLLRERYNNGFWYQEKDHELAFSILDKSDGLAAWEFLKSHTDYEYESVELKYLE